MTKKIFKAAVVAVAMFGLSSAVSAKTLKGSDVDLKSVSKIIDGDFSPKYDKKEIKLSIKTKLENSIIINPTTKILTISSKIDPKRKDVDDLLEIANQINANYSLVQASYRTQSRDESTSFVLEASIPYAGGLDSENLNELLRSFRNAAEKLKDLM